MEKVDVVILHYNNAEDTVKYIENLRQLNWEGLEHHFIIVDNASPDGSGEQLQRKYGADSDVIVLQSQDNLGFAKGNNLAFLTLEVRASNYGAIALYGAHGFRGVGRRPNYYEHPKEDAIIMTREFKNDGN